MRGETRRYVIHDGKVEGGEILGKNDAPEALNGCLEDLSVVATALLKLYRNKHSSTLSVSVPRVL
jgi:hypothetical protein